MSFGRWILVHSFSLFVLALIIMFYLFRNELLLDKAYRQLLGLETIQLDEKPSEKQAKPKKISHLVETENGKHSTAPVQSADAEKKNSVPQKLVAVPTLGSKNHSTAGRQPGDLIRARKAYWNNDYAKAIDEYQRLIEQNPSNPDYMGELGNIFYTLNDDERAAKLYYQAAMLFIQQNKLQHARSLIAPVTAMNRELGEQLEQKLKH